MCVIRTVRGVGGGDVSHLMVALSSRPSSSTAAIWGMRPRNLMLDSLDVCYSLTYSQFHNRKCRQVICGLTPGIPFFCVSSDHWAVGQRKHNHQYRHFPDAEKLKTIGSSMLISYTIRCSQANTRASIPRSILRDNWQTTIWTIKQIQALRKMTRLALLSFWCKMGAHMNIFRGVSLPIHIWSV